MNKKIFHILGWLTTGLLLYLVLRKVNFNSLLSGFKSANFQLVVAAAIINFIVVIAKALRFKWLIKLGEKTKFKDVLYATIIGFAANNVFPARGGELVRIHMLSENGKRSKISLAAVALLEKFFDATGILTLMIILLLVPSRPQWMDKGIFTTIAVIIASVILSIILKKMETRLTNKKGFLKKLTDGVKALHNGKDFALNYSITIPICLIQIMMLYAIQQSFGVALPLWITGVAFITMNLAIAIPSAPSHLGTMEFALLLVYTYFGLKKETALNIALMYHAVQFFPLILSGLVCYFITSSRPRQSMLSKG